MALFRFGLNHHHDELNMINVEKNRYKNGKLLIFACFFLFTSCMAAKGVFSAEQKYIVDLWQLEYAQASMANTFYFVAYGLVQIGLFFVMSKININKYMIFTIPFAAIFTALIGFANNIEQIWIYFGISGIFQASVYCGCNYALTRYLPLNLLSTANKIMNVGYACGSVFSYGVCALCITFNLWRVPYFIIGGMFAIALIVFAIVISKAARFKHINEMLDKKTVKKQKNKTINKAMSFEQDPLFTLNTKKKLVLFYIVDLTLAFFITALFYCVMNYITSLLVDVHGLSQDISIYVSIIAPIAIVLGPMLTINTCDNKRDFIRAGILYSLAILPVPVLLALFYDSNIFVALALSIIFIVIVNGVKAIVLSVLTFRMRRQINSGSYSAISNAVASISAGVTPTIIGSIIDNAGWAAAYWVTFGITAFVIISLVIIDVFIRRSYRKSHNLSVGEKI